MFDQWPHYTATMVELATGQRYTLDSWYFDNGQPALVVRNETWRGSLEELIACMREGDEGGEVRKTPAECGVS